MLEQAPLVEREDAVASAKSAPPRRGFGRRIAAFGVSASVLALAAGLGVAAIVALKERADAVAGPAPTPPLPVETIAVAFLDSYATAERFSGRLEPARSAELAFERGGRVEAVLVDEGARVDAGAALARLDVDLLGARREALVARRAAAEAERALAERTRARQGDLSAKGFASDQRFDEAETRAIALDAEIAALAAEVRGLDLEISKSTLTAPFAGAIGARHVDPGAMAAAGQPALSILETSRPQIRIGVPPEQARTLEPGRVYPVEIAGAVVGARLAALRPDIAPGTRTVAALFDVVDAGAVGRARFGDIARLTLEREVAGRGFWVPLGALRESVEGLWSVYVLRPRAEGETAVQVEETAVAVLHVEDGRAYVSGPLGPDWRLVVSGVNRVTRGQTVAATAIAR